MRRPQIRWVMESRLARQGRTLVHRLSPACTGRIMRVNTFSMLAQVLGSLYAFCKSGSPRSSPPRETDFRKPAGVEFGVYVNPEFPPGGRLLRIFSAAAPVLVAVAYQ